MLVSVNWIKHIFVDALSCYNKATNNLQEYVAMLAMVWFPSINNDTVLNSIFKILD